MNAALDALLRAHERLHWMRADWVHDAVEGQLKRSAHGKVDPDDVEDFKLNAEAIRATYAKIVEAYADGDTPRARPYLRALDVKGALLDQARRPGGRAAANLAEDRALVEKTLELAPAYWTSHEMTRLVAAGGEALPDDAVVEPRSFPSERGFVLLETPWAFLDTWTLSAFAWNSGKIGDVEALLLVGWNVQQLPLLAFVTDYGRTVKDLEKDERFTAFPDWVKFMLSFGSMVQQRLATTTAVPVDRPTRRRAERVGVTGREVRAVTLRKRERHDGDGAPRTVEWTCQWLVSGHWRNAKVKDGHRLVWIAPYVKGPDDAPPRFDVAKVFRVAR